MLSSVLNSKRVILVNIAIIRAFVRLRQILAAHQELAQRFEELDEQVGQNTADIETVSRIIQQLLEPSPENTAMTTTMERINSAIRLAL